MVEISETHSEKAACCSADGQAVAENENQVITKEVTNTNDVVESKEETTTTSY